jgi:hypothetical protein
MQATTVRAMCADSSTPCAVDAANDADKATSAASQPTMVLGLGLALAVMLALVASQ